ncbi:MAG: disulfide oxidoreductase [Desulfuromonas sp.]|mgnify:CR=1 FL=1|nr:MAG: disulfide oxidoreductase [Desulfuromonas sp.]
MIDKATKMAEILKCHPQAKEVLESFGLCCSTCSGAKHESLEQGAINHGLDVNELLNRLNALFVDS